MRMPIRLSNQLYRQSIFRDGSMRDWTESEWADIHSRFNPTFTLTKRNQLTQLGQRFKVAFVYSHVTAAIIHGLPLPHDLSVSNNHAAHITVSRIGVRPQRKHVVTHTGEIQPDEFQMIHDLPVTSLGRTIADLAKFLTIPELNSALEARSKDPQDTLEHALRRLHFPGRGNILKLAYLRRFDRQLRCPKPWQGLVWAHIAIACHSYPALKSMRDQDYLTFPQHRIVVPQPYSYRDDRTTVIERTAEFVYLRSRGLRPVCYSLLDLTKPHFIRESYMVSRSRPTHL